MTDDEIIDMIPHLTGHASWVHVMLPVPSALDAFIQIIQNTDAVKHFGDKRT